MESCEDDTEVESVDGSTISSSSGSDTVLEDNPPDDNSNFSSTLANLGSEDDLKYISADSDKTTEQQESAKTLKLKPGKFGLRMIFILYTYVLKKIFNFPLIFSIFVCITFFWRDAVRQLTFTVTDLNWNWQ